MIAGDELRRQAERAARDQAPGSREDPEAPSPEGLRRIIHELRVHQIELEMQNEELRRAQAELDAARSRYFDLYDLAPVGYVTVNEQGLILEANLTASTLLGVVRGRKAAQPIFSRFILKDDQDIYYRSRRRIAETGEPQAFDLRMTRKDGSLFWAHLETMAADEAEGDRLFRIVLSDITERRRAEESLQRSYQENQALLGELQHRVKNSFAMISSMIGLASSATSSPETRAAIDDLDTRVRSVSELYSLLYAAGSFSEVRLDDYFARVAVPLVGLSGAVALRTALEAVVVPVKEAATIGLILTELVTNALKHGFPGGASGTVAVSLARTGSGALLEVQDDGVGMAPGREFSGKAGIGLSLVRALCEQIHGRFTIEAARAGTRCAVEFPIEASA